MKKEEKTHPIANDIMSYVIGGTMFVTALAAVNAATNKSSANTEDAVDKIRFACADDLIRGEQNLGINQIIESGFTRVVDKHGNIFVGSGFSKAADVFAGYLRAIGSNGYVYASHPQADGTGKITYTTPYTTTWGVEDGLMPVQYNQSNPPCNAAEIRIPQKVLQQRGR